MQDGYCFDSGDTAAGQTMSEVYLPHRSLRWGLPFGSSGLSHAGVPCSFISLRSMDVPRGCALPLAPLHTPTPNAEHGLIDVLTMANCFKAPAIPTYWSRPTVMCHFLGPVAVRLLFPSFPRCLSVLSPSCEIWKRSKYRCRGSN